MAWCYSFILWPFVHFKTGFSSHTSPYNFSENSCSDMRQTDTSSLLGGTLKQTVGWSRPGQLYWRANSTNGVGELGLSRVIMQVLQSAQFNKKRRKGRGGGVVHNDIHSIIKGMKRSLMKKGKDELTRHDEMFFFQKFFTKSSKEQAGHVLRD